jgi:hypothetical protein
LRVRPRQYRPNSRARRAGDFGDDRDLLADEPVDQRGLPDVRTTDERDESAAMPVGDDVIEPAEDRGDVEVASFPGAQR